MEIGFCVKRTSRQRYHLLACRKTLHAYVYKCLANENILYGPANMNVISIQLIFVSLCQFLSFSSVEASTELIFVVYGCSILHVLHVSLMCALGCVCGFHMNSTNQLTTIFSVDRHRAGIYVEHNLN